MNLPTFKHALFLAAVFWLGTLPPSLAAQSLDPIFSDNFESGDFSHSENRFRWGAPNRTSIVRDDGCAVHIDPPRCVEGNPGQWENGPGDLGRHSMRFRYPAGVAMAEQRFSIGGAYDEIWIRYWLRVPVNFNMNPQGPNSSNNNQKFFALWQDGYSGGGTGATITWNFWRQSSNGGARFSFQNSRDNQSSGHFGHFENFMLPEDAGRWMQVVLYARNSSASGEPDGEVGIWRRWEDEADFTEISVVPGRGFSWPTSGPVDWQGGYIMGWANSTYAETTEFLLDDFVISTSNLLTSTPRPRAPIDVEAR
jgi:hypothetical protein